MRTISSIFLTFIFLATILSTFAQQAGCTDPLATNFNAAAVENDGSCRYLPVFHNPPFAFELPAKVSETSGLVFYHNKLWTINDSGGDATLYAIDTATHEIVRRVNVSNAVNVDWEEITMDQNYLYIGDFGNNRGNRKDLAVYRIDLTHLAGSGDYTVEAEKIRFHYPEQIDFKGSNNHNFDCEAFVSYNDYLYLFTKNRGDQYTQLYRLPSAPGKHAASLIGSFNSVGLVTAAALNTERMEIVLLGYVQKVWTPFLWILFDFEGDDFFGGNKRRIDLANLSTTQTEGICLIDSMNYFISSESSPTFSSRVFRFNAAPWIDHLDTNSRLRPMKGALIRLDEAASDSSKLVLIISKARTGKSRVDISDATGKVVYSVPVIIEKDAFYLEVDTIRIPEGKFIVSLINNRRIVSQEFAK
ncbi:MAG: hypothetical protein Q8S18_06510 [Bacteroidales bacterium]|nr:hypothetical protein [Bacteroidales bacterium]